MHCQLDSIGLPELKREATKLVDSVCVITLTASRGRQEFCTAGEYYNMLIIYCNKKEKLFTMFSSPAVRGRAPTCMWVSSQETSELVLLKPLQQSPVIQDGADIHWGQCLRALRARNAHPAL